MNIQENHKHEWIPDEIFRNCEICACGKLRIILNYGYEQNTHRSIIR